MRDNKLLIILIICSSILINTSSACAGSVTLSWEESITNADGTPLTDLQGYKIHYGTDSNNFTNHIMIGNVTTYQVTDLNVGEIYYFVVTAYDFTGNESSYSPLVSIKIENSPPPAPELINPKNNGTYKGKKVGFKWRKSNDPDGNMVTYDLTICQDANLTTGCITETNIASRMNQGIYYAGIGTFGSGLLFFGVALIFPLNKKNVRSIQLLLVAIAVAGMLFLISCGEGAERGFRLSSDRLSGDNASADEVIQMEQELGGGSTYYWQVIARDDKGGETYSPVWSFYIQ